MSGLQIKQPQVLNLMRAICFCPYNKTLQNFESILNEPLLNLNQNEPKCSDVQILLGEFIKCLFARAYCIVLKIHQRNDEFLISDVNALWQFVTILRFSKFVVNLFLVTLYLLVHFRHSTNCK